MAERCEHKVSERQAIGMGVDQFTSSIGAIMCLRCGKVLFKHWIKPDQD